jgi:hypothetical protein
MATSRACLGALLLCMVALAAPHSHAGERAASEDAVKAAYLYKLRNYVEWPAGTPAKVIGVLGADEIVELLLEIPAVRDKASGAATIKRLQAGDPLTGISVLFVGDAYWQRAAAMVAQAGERSILVVSESKLALAGGSVINFQVIDERIRFEISLDAADKAGLKVSSQLLALAVSVVREKRK